MSNNIPTYDDLKKLKNFPETFDISDEENKQRSHVFCDPYDFTYKFINCQYDKSGKRSFNHVEIDREFFEFHPTEREAKIKEAIEKLNSQHCWKINSLGTVKMISDCMLCKKISF